MYLIGHNLSLTAKNLKKIWKFKFLMLDHESILRLVLTIGAGALIQTSCIERSKICGHFNWIALATMDVGLTGIKDAVMRLLAIWHSATLAGIKVATFWWQGSIGFISQRVVVVI